jgi:hypothetical protein
VAGGAGASPVVGTVERWGASTRGAGATVWSSPACRVPERQAGLQVTAAALVAAAEALAREPGATVSCLHLRSWNLRTPRRTVTATFTSAVAAFAVERAGTAGRNRSLADGHPVDACFVS